MTKDEAIRILGEVRGGCDVESKEYAALTLGIRAVKAVNLIGFNAWAMHELIEGAMLDDD